MKSTDPICSFSSMRVVISITLLFLVSVVNNLKALSGDYELIRLTFFTGIYSTHSQSSDTLLVRDFSTSEEAIQNTEFDPGPSIYFVGIPDNLVLNCGEALPDWPVVIATDNSVEFNVTPKERDDFSPCGGKIITRIWSVTNPEGIEISKEQRIAFTDNTAPSIKICNDTIVASGSELPLAFYEASDQGCSTFTVDITEDEYELTEYLTSILRKYTVTDGCGNSTTKIQHIQVKSKGNKIDQKSNSVSVLEYRK